MNRYILIGAVGIVILVLALGLNTWMTGEPDTDTAPPPAAVGETVPPSEAGRSADMPSFDVVRVDPSGNTVIAGRARPGAKVRVLDGETVVGEATADSRGEWVIVPDQPIAPGDRRLTLEATQDGTTRQSDHVVVLSVPERPGGRAREPAVAMLTPRDGSGPSRILQRPDGPPPPNSLTLDVIDYDNAGNLSLSGTANVPSPSGATRGVRVYLDNKPIGDATVAPDGRWSLRPEGLVAPGLYTLRVDQLADDKVVARIELPFSRSEPLLGFAEDRYIVVQPGQSLWRIAHRALGDGFRYSVLYEANHDQIRDPNLIYPGQVIAVPR